MIFLLIKRPCVSKLFLLLFRVEVTNKANQTPSHWVYNDMTLEDNLIVSNGDLIYPFAASQSTFNSYIGKCFSYFGTTKVHSRLTALKAFEEHSNSFTKSLKLYQNFSFRVTSSKLSFDYSSVISDYSLDYILVISNIYLSYL